MAHVEETHCCGLPQVTADASDSAKDILNTIQKYLLEDHYYNNCDLCRDQGRDCTFPCPKTESIINPNSAPHAYWCITCPNEKKLTEELQKAGFKYQFSFHRRKVCGEGKLKYWLLEV